MTAGEEHQAVRKKAAECIRQFLAGRVSWDHLIEEFGRTGDEVLGEAVRLIEEEVEGLDRYAKMERPGREFRERMERLAGRLES